VEVPATELRQKQVYAYWMQLNRDAWRLHNDQLESARLVLDKFDGADVETIPIPLEDGIVPDIEEVAMDSTCM
jgi:hypothetical protein